MRDFFGRYWFTLALVGVLVLAIPGFLLFAIDLFGWTGPVNRWLEKTYQLSYGNPLPWWGALLLLLVPPLIILLYFLKLKRKPLSVPSTFLWRKSIEDLHVNTLFQWLRQNILLILQLLTVVALIYAIMAFRFHGRTGEGKHYILMIDNSASMSANDIQPSRLDWAKQEARKEIDAAGDDDVGMVIVFNSSAEILQSYTTSKGLLWQALDRIEPTQRPTRIEEALSLADSLANKTRSTENEAARPVDQEPGKERTYVPAEGIPTEVHLFSDGRFPDVPDFALGNINLNYHAAGQPGPQAVDNVGLVALNAQRDEEDASKLFLLVSAYNYGAQPVPGRVQIDIHVNGRLTDSKEKPLELPARKVTEEPQAGKDEPLRSDQPGEGTVTFELSELDERANVVVHARLPGHKDHFPLDDEAWLVIGVVRKARVLVVGKPNEPLDAFFDQETIPLVAHIERLGPESLGTDAYLKPARDGAYDLVVFDRCGPAREEDMPRANTFFVGHPPPSVKSGPVDKIKNPVVKGWQDKSAVLRNLAALYEVGVDEAFRVKDLPPRTPRLIESDQDTLLLFSLSRQSFTDLVLAFPVITDDDKYNTNWPLLPSFPLFLRNVLYALGNVSDAAGEETVQPGQPKVLRPDAVVKEIQVAGPRGDRETLDRGTRADFVYGSTDRVGVYQVAWNGEVQRNFAVNLLDPLESNLEPRAAIGIGAETVEAGKTRGQPRELWKWAVLAGLLALLLEWYIYNRRVYV